MDNVAIRLEHITKIYKLYTRNRDRLKDSLGLTKKKCYSEHYALKDVSMTIRQGETVGIIGVNGSGKSTILKIITGVLSATGGEMKINGRISALLELGAGFNMEYTGLENVYLNGTMLGFSEEEIDGRLQDILDFADIGEFIHQPVKTYSSGMFVRLAFAVAINIDPEILIVDEALSVGDVFFQAKCYKKFEDFKKLGKTILFVSHDLGSVAKYCDRVILLDRGKKLMEGEPKPVIDTYKKLLVHQMEPEPEEASVQEFRVEIENWKGHLKQNPDCVEYGNGTAKIVDYALVDEKGRITDSISKGELFRIKYKVVFQKAVEDPIFAFTIKDLKGTEISGTNTMYERIFVDKVQAGETRVACFEQRLDLQGGEYLISLGCTGYVGEEFQVFHRLYDVCSLSVISDKNSVGFYDMNSKITVV